MNMQQLMERSETTALSQEERKSKFEEDLANTSGISVGRTRDVGNRNISTEMIAEITNQQPEEIHEEEDPNITLKNFAS